jgi:hypothetical protein
MSGKRAAAMLEKEADMVVSSLAKAADAAVEATKDHIDGVLQNNRPLMFLLSGMLRNKEWIGILEQSLVMSPAAASQVEGEEKKTVVWKMRTGLQTMEHLKRQSGSLFKLTKDGL